MRRRIPTFVPTSLEALARQVQEWARQMAKDTTDYRVLTLQYPDEIAYLGNRKFRLFAQNGPLRDILVKRVTFWCWGANSPNMYCAVKKQPSGVSAYSISLSGNYAQWGEQASPVTVGADALKNGEWYEVEVGVSGSGSSSEIREVSVMIEYEDWTERR